MNARIPDMLSSHDSPAAQRQQDAHFAREVYDTKAAEVAEWRGVREAMQKVPVWAKSPNGYAHVLAIVSSEIGKTPWAHVMAADAAMDALNNAHDDLEAYADKCSREVGA